MPDLIHRIICEIRNAVVVCNPAMRRHKEGKISPEDLIGRLERILLKAESLLQTLKEKGI